MLPVVAMGDWEQIAMALMLAQRCWAWVRMMNSPTLSKTLMP